jgi:AraC family transcriptional regulator of arabinose operon
MTRRVCTEDDFTVARTPRQSAPDSSSAGIVARCCTPPARAYVHRKTRSCLTATTSMPPRTVCRQEVVIVLSIHPRAPFTLDAADHGASTTSALVIQPGTPHRIAATSGPVVCLTVPLIHPRFAHVRRLVRQPLVPIARAAFAHLDDRLLAALLGHLKLQQGGELAEEILDVVLAGHAPAPALDPRVRIAMHALMAEADCAFWRIADDLKLSPSRLSHLFVQELGVSMRDCQAWCRLARAWEMVVWRRDLNFTEIAHLLCFSDSSHLARSIRKTYGRPPRDLRAPTVMQVHGDPGHYPWPRGLACG